MSVYLVNKHSRSFLMVLGSKSNLILGLFTIVAFISVFNSLYRSNSFVKFVFDDSTKFTLGPLKFTDSDAPSHCYCNGELFCFKGVNKYGQAKYGLLFNCSLYDGLVKNNLLFDQIEQTEPYYKKIDESWEPVFVTSISQNHLLEGRTLIKRIRVYYPSSKIIIFDVGLNKDAIQEFDSICNVEIKSFNFSKYPPHVSFLKNYSFKLILLEVLQFEKAFFYFDTSVLIKAFNMHTSFIKAINENLLPPFSTHIFTYHSIYAATHPDMYKYLPVPAEAVQIQEIQSTSMFVVDSPYTRRIMKWWYLCAMTKECIAPDTANVECKVNKFKDRWHVYMNCHRFDQSFWNIYSVVELFGEDRQALRRNYINTNFDYIDLSLAKKVDKKQYEALNPFFNGLIKIKRNNPTYFPLVSPCVSEEHDNIVLVK